VTIWNLSKRLARALALIAVTPALCSFRVRAAILGRNRALEGSTQLLALVPGLAGQYLRRAFLMRTLEHCHADATVEFGTIFSDARARIGEHAYVGPRCHLGLVHLGKGVLLAAGVHVPSGARTHGIADVAAPIREQEGHRAVVRIGAGAWIGSAAVVMADVGEDSVVGAGAVVTRPLPAGVVAAGVPARVIRNRTRATERTA
jgi:virginiamycin A acetyltransferase